MTARRFVESLRYKVGGPVQVAEGGGLEGVPRHLPAVQGPAQLCRQGVHRAACWRYGMRVVLT